MSGGATPNGTPTDLRCGVQTATFKMGCGEPITSIHDLYRCATCDVAFHKPCLVRHFNWQDDLVPTPSNIERLAIAERRVAELEEAARG